MKSSIFKIILTTSLVFASCSTKEKKAAIASTESTSLVEYVNPLMGTDSEFSLSNGNTYPAIATP